MQRPTQQLVKNVKGNEATAIPPGYKQTEVGVLPQDWEVQPIGCMGEVVTGKALYYFCLPGIH